VQFDASGSTDPNGDATIVGYAWDFGDGNTGTGVNPAHTYDAEGLYDVSLTVTDDTGLTGTDATTANIEIVPQIPVADAGGPYAGKEGREVNFDGSASFDPDGGAITAYAWDFGDGSTGIGATPTHVYAAAGSYSVSLIVTDDEGDQSDPASTTAVIDPDEAPTAVSGGPYAGTVNEAVNFDGSGSFDPDGTVVGYAWDFGDGTTGTGANPTHAYAATGDFIVTLTVTDDFGNLSAPATTTATIGIGDLPPVADANGPYSGTVGAEVQFDGSGSSDPNGDDTIVSYDWEFGDGTVASDSGPMPTHVYDTAGTYNVTLTVTDDTGLVDSAGSSATIEPPPLEAPIADPNGPYSAPVGTPVQFDGSASYDPDGGEIVRYDWDFGDGTVAADAGAMPTHTYALEGEYIVTLAVTDDEGETGTGSSTATISPLGGETDVFLTRMDAPSFLELPKGRKTERDVTAFGDGVGIEQAATVRLAADDGGDGVAVEIERYRLTRTVVPGDPETAFEFEVEIKCEKKGRHEIVWTATIDAEENPDPTNDRVQAVTTVECGDEGEGEEEDD
jgi:PKD repeat protein